MFGGIAIVVACSDTQKPPPVQLDNDGSAKNQDGATSSSGGDAIADVTGDAKFADSCYDKIRNGFETDVDCGGNECPPCFDGKDCVANTDCAGGFCDNKVCNTASCKDKKLSGDETDVDCGGKTCPRCGFGKKCTVDDDCVSKKCDNASKQCACPTRMVVAATNAALGGAYCIDETEVTNGDYDRFVKANQSIAQQIPTCATANTSYVPSGAWPPDQPLSVGYPIPVRYVDWCDAYAYCKWAGKQLCGAIGGGSNPVASATDHQKSAWFNACSAQNANTYPYAGTFDPNRCWTSPLGHADSGALSGPMPVSTFQNDGSYSSIPVEAFYRSCQGGATGLYQMSGNVAEWEDSCTGTASTDDCLVRGGSWLANNDNNAVACSGKEQVGRMVPRADIGFRCCQY